MLAQHWSFFRLSFFRLSFFRLSSCSLNPPTNLVLPTRVLWALPTLFIPISCEMVSSITTASALSIRTVLCHHQHLVIFDPHVPCYSNTPAPYDVKFIHAFRRWPFVFQVAPTR
ncbi:hypothetical protein CPB84DRAFT_1773805 [Gymnopilus junonius]|uniref:Secreted protein n=1 Tax=Gymnopilus junonius TaxID=109634 RepID=A0A9P5NSY5_GYMJU|nr:hypothetical protein CPB84DRAFT_1773805 [Gymnopilus junonius]